MWWRILLVFFIAIYLIIALAVSKGDGFVAKNKKTVLGIALGLCALIIGQGMYSSYAEKAEIEGKKAKFEEANNAIQQHLLNRDYKSAMAEIVKNDGTGEWLPDGVDGDSKKWYGVSANKYIQAFLDAGEAEMAYQLYKRSSSHTHDEERSMIKALYNKGLIDQAYELAESAESQFSESKVAPLVLEHMTDLCEQGKKTEAKAIMLKKKSAIHGKNHFEEDANAILKQYK